jgi:hypothetical protein
MRQIPLFLLLLILAACGGSGSGGGATSSNAQLATSVADLSTYKTTFADTTKLDGTLETASLSFEQILYKFKSFSVLPEAYANALTTCNSNVNLVAIDDSTSTTKYKKYSATTNTADKPCFISSQEAGDYIVAQAKNLYKGTKKCDILVTPINGGALHCLEAGISSEVTSTAGDPIFRFSENLFGGTGSSKGLGGRMTVNGKYFFIAFNNDTSDAAKTTMYDGVYRIDLSGSTPAGQTVYLSNPTKLDCPPCKKWSFDGFNPLENGDLIVEHYDLTSSVNRKAHYYIPVSSAVTKYSDQNKVLINEGDAPSGMVFEADFVNSPIFKWSKTISTSATAGDTMAPYFSFSQDPTDKSFITSISVDKYRATNAARRIMVKGTVSNNAIIFEDLGNTQPVGGQTSFDNPSHSWISDDLTKIYTLKTGSSPIEINVEPVGLNQGISLIVTNITPTAGYTEHVIQITKNSFFITSFKNTFWNTNGEMFYEASSISKTDSGIDWSERPTQFQAVNMGVFTGADYLAESLIPSLSGDRLYFKFKKVSTGDIISADMTPTRFKNVINLGSKGGIASNQVIVSRK